MTPKSGKTSATSKADKDGTITAGTLTNSLKTEVSLTKDWLNSDGTAVTKDYLGCDLSVTFELQAAKVPEGGTASSSEGWESAEDFLKRNLSADDYAAVTGGDYAFEQTISGRINESWKAAAFKNLPAWIKGGSSGGGQDLVIPVQYRIVEKEIAYTLPGEQERIVEVQNQTFDNGSWTYQYNDVLFTPACPANRDAYDTNDQIVYNGLQTSALTVVKNWAGDSSNVYHTRPENRQNGKDWETSFLIQRYTQAGEDWENVLDYSKGNKDGEPLVITLYGADSEDAAEKTVSNLPKGQYRAVELQPGYKLTELDVSVIEPENTSLPSAEGEGDALYNKGYKVNYKLNSENPDHPAITVANTLETAEYMEVLCWTETRMRI